MKKGNSKIIGIKVGSNLLVKTDLHEEVINQEFIRSLCWQVAYLWCNHGHRVFIVTSGAIKSDQKEGRSDNLRASVGQLKLMQIYSENFKVFGLPEIGQILLTDYDLHHPGIFIKTVSEAFNEGVVPIINANDPVSDKESGNLKKCSDNDHLFAHACKALGIVDMALMGFDNEGLLDSQDGVIRRISAREEKTYLTYARGANPLGTGGMRSKLIHLCFLARSGIKTIMVPAKRPNAFLRGVDILSGASQEEFGTVFVP